MIKAFVKQQCAITQMKLLSGIKVKVNKGSSIN